MSVTCNQLQKLLGKDVIFYSVGEEGLRAPQFFPAHPGIGPDAYTTGNERAVASWVYHNNKHAGATTNTRGDSKCLYLSVRVGTQVYGVVGLVIGGAPLDAFENSIVLSILGECALALKNERTCLLYTSSSNRGSGRSSRTCARWGSRPS